MVPVASNAWQPRLTLTPASAVRRRTITIGVDPVHRVIGQHAGLADGRAERGGLPQPLSLQQNRHIHIAGSLRQALFCRNIETSPAAGAQITSPGGSHEGRKSAGRARPSPVPAGRGDCGGGRRAAGGMPRRANATPALARINYPSSKVANVKDLKPDQPVQIAYPDKDSPGVIIKLGRTGRWRCRS